jgi:hypothetical protein
MADACSLSLCFAVPTITCSELYLDSVFYFQLNCLPVASKIVIFDRWSGVPINYISNA